MSQTQFPQNSKLTFSSKIVPNIEQMFDLVLSFSIGYLFEPFQSNKRSVRAIIGIVINTFDNLRVKLWTQIEGLFRAQTENMLYTSPVLGNQGMSNYHTNLFILTFLFCFI